MNCLRLCVLLYLCIAFPLAAQVTKTDSLKKLLAKASNNQVINIQNQLSELYRNIDADSSLLYANQAIAAAEKDGSETQLAIGYINAGVTHRNKGNSKRALEHFLNALLLADKLEDKHMEADVLHKVGVTHLFVKEFKEAVDFAKREEAIWKELNNHSGLSAALNLSGLAYSNLQEYDLAFRKFNEALQLGKEMKDNELIYKPLVNLGDLYYRTGDAAKAIEYIKESRAICEKTGNKVGIAAAAVNMSKAYLLMKEYDKAILSQEEAIRVATEIQSLPLLRNSYGLCSQIYEASGNYAKALSYHKLYKKIEDSLADKNSRQNVTSLEAKYQNEKKRQTILLLETQNQNKELQLYVLFAAVVGAIFLLFGLYNRYQYKNRYSKNLRETNQELQKKSQEITAQRDIIEAQNRNMVESLYAAKSIQEALLPVSVPELSAFKESFTVNLPRDVVSGDFCWFEYLPNTTDKNQIVFALGDCTGHGVPAAFLTITCNGLLVDILKEFPSKSPAFWLEELHRRFVQVFRQAQSFQHQGVDLALCTYNVQTKVLVYAGAKIPLYYFKDGIIHTIKPNRQSIGSDTQVVTPSYDEHTIQFNEGETFYITSDGFQDQFGGERNRKFMITQWRDLLSNVQPYAFHLQQDIIMASKRNWQGNNPQTDDILVLGVRI